jgi:hypothetical protein
MNRLAMVNRVLSNVSCPFADTTADPDEEVLRAVFSCETAFRDVMMMGKWVFNRDYRNADSWDNEDATLEGLTDIVSVLWEHEQDNIPIRTWVPDTYADNFYRQAVQAMSDSITHPLYYAQVTSTLFKVNPYPDTVERQERLWFYGYYERSFPSADMDDTDIPVDVEELVIRRASYLMAVRHLTDLNLASFFNGEYEQMLHQIRNRYLAIPMRSRNMYRSV